MGEDARLRNEQKRRREELITEFVRQRGYFISSLHEKYIRIK